MANSKVTIIKPKINPLTHLKTSSITKRRVAGYARVSTNLEEQATSYDAQVDYYTTMINSRPEWELVKVYTDEGISGTNTKKRAGFNQMIDDALNGKIDLIITKSVSRFARNTVDSLVNIRRLKEKGVEVYFEKENIYTLDSKGELLLTIMSSIAQEESRSISENVKWGIRKGFADGKVSLAYSKFLGYTKNEKGDIVIVPKEAEVVRRIYRMYLEGFTQGKIAEILTNEGIPTPSNKSKWQYAVVDSILQNEKYKGSALLQKTFTTNFLTKNSKKNEGEIPQYYIEESHPPIINPYEWEQVQAERKLRYSSEVRPNKSSVFIGRIFCEECGATFGPKTWHSTDKYKKVIWRCNNKYRDKEHKCTSPHIDETRLKEMCLEVINQVITNKKAIINDFELVKEVLFKPVDESKLQQIEDEIRIIDELIKKHMEKATDSSVSHEAYIDEYESLVKRHNDAESRYNTLMEENEMRKTKYIAITSFIDTLKKCKELQLQFDESLFNKIIQKLIVTHDGFVLFVLRNGKEIKIAI